MNGIDDELFRWALTGVGAVVAGLLCGLRVLWTKTEAHNTETKKRLSDCEEDRVSLRTDLNVLQVKVAGLEGSNGGQRDA